MAPFSMLENYLNNLNILVLRILNLFFRVIYRPTFQTFRTWILIGNLILAKGIYLYKTSKDILGDFEKGYIKKL